MVKRRQSKTTTITVTEWGEHNSSKVYKTDREERFISQQGKVGFTSQQQSQTTRQQEVKELTIGKLCN